MSLHSFKVIQKIPVPLAKAWDFFSSPANLQAITPSQMNFRTISKYDGDKVYEGQIIEYRVSPYFRIPLYWMTEIAEVVDGVYFIDEQKKGPYSLWRHQHHFKTIEGGVEMTDIVHYKIPFGWLGDLLNKILIKNKLRRIFEYRYQKTEELLGKWPE